jgi:hypothetical protein
LGAGRTITRAEDGGCRKGRKKLYEKVDKKYTLAGCSTTRNVGRILLSSIVSVWYTG